MLHCAEATSKLISQAGPQLLFTQLWIGSIYPVCLGGCYWLASFVCANRIFLEKETEGRSETEERKQGEKIIIQKCYTDAAGHPPLSLLQWDFLAPCIGMGLLCGKVPSALNKTFGFVHMDTPNAPHAPSLLSSWNNFTLIWVICTHPILIHGIWFLTTFFQDCIFHSLIWLCTKKISTQITGNDMMHHPSLRKSPLTQAKRARVLQWRLNLSEITVGSIINQMIWQGCQINNSMLIPILNCDLIPTFSSIFYGLRSNKALGIVLLMPFLNFT